MSSPSALAYKQGDFKLIWDHTMVDARWRDQRTIALCNRVFDFYCQAARNVKKVRDGHRDRHGVWQLSNFELGEAMWKQLKDCATRRVRRDLYDVFDGSGKAEGVFDDTSASNYYGGHGKFFDQLIHTLPTGVVNFLDAVDKRTKELAQAFDGYLQAVDEVEAADHGADTDWAFVRSALDKVNKQADNVKTYLWLAPSSIEAKIYDYGVDGVLDQVVTVTDVIGNIADGAEVYIEARAAGMDENTSQAIGLMRTAVSYLPVLGQFYGKAIEMIPGLYAGYNDVIDQRARIIETASWGKMQPHGAR